MSRRASEKSREDYLKSILIIQLKFGACRVIDVAKQMGVSKSSASVALKKLEEEGYAWKSDWRVLLTEQGKEIAESLYEKELFFTECLIRMGVREETAKEDACQIGAVISEETFGKMKDLFMLDQPEKVLKTG